ncbi:hypothetical protein N7528_005478 [Penicillium herquei]|nr:hypothetical protein N7528_005478 [Penicillium herquei]
MGLGREVANVEFSARWYQVHRDHRRRLPDLNEAGVRIALNLVVFFGRKAACAHLRQRGRPVNVPRIRPEEKFSYKGLVQLLCYMAMVWRARWDDGKADA